MDGAIKDLLERLTKEGVSKIYVGDLTGVLETHWKATVNEKTHNFWAYRRFIDRLENKAEEYGVEVHEENEAWTSQRCPRCGETENNDTTQGNIDVCLWL